MGSIRNILAGFRRIAVFCAALCIIATSPATQAQDTRQYKIEAAFLYNFFNYIVWPGYSAPTDLREATICVSSGDPVAEYLAYVQHKVSKERTLIVRPWKKGESVEGCHLLFVRTGSGRADAPVSSGTLTISDDDDYIDHGGMIGLEPEEGRIGLNINNSLLNEKGFQVSSRLLKLAQEVK